MKPPGMKNSKRNFILRPVDSDNELRLYLTGFSIKILTLIQPTPFDGVVIFAVTCSQSVLLWSSVNSISTIFSSSCLSSASFFLGGGGGGGGSSTITLCKVIVGYHHHYYTNVSGNVPFISNAHNFNI